MIFLSGVKNKFDIYVWNTVLGPAGAQSFPLALECGEW